MKLPRTFRSNLRGFTLLEMMVSIAIMTVISTTLIYRYPETSIRLNLANDNQAIALMLREAQIRGSAIDSVNSSLGGYGVHLNTNTPRTIILFGDLIDDSIDKPNGLPVGNGLYDFSPINETKTMTTFATGYVISKICVGTSFPFTCTTNNIPAITALTISFTRPNPQPNIYINNSSAASFSGACIEIRSPRAPRPGQNAPSAGHIRSVQVYTSGMIRTSANKCDNSI